MNAILPLYFNPVNLQNDCHTFVLMSHTDSVKWYLLKCNIRILTFIAIIICLFTILFGVNNAYMCSSYSSILLYPDF